MPRQYINRSVNASLNDGAAWAAMSGFADTYSVPMAMALGASTSAVGLLKSLPFLISSAAQIFIEKFIKAVGRCRRAILISVAVQALSLYAAAFSILMPKTAGLAFFLCMIVVYTAAGNAASAPWSALMGEYIPPAKRGSFFGFRYQIVGIAFFAGSYLASRILDLLKGRGLLGFFVVFTVAGLLRTVSFFQITRMYEPRTDFHMPGASRVNFLSALDFRKGRSPALFFSVFLMLLGTYIAAPYFSVYSLKELKSSYPQFMVLMTIGQLMTYMLMRRWGRAADVYGSVKILKSAFLLIPTVPLLWSLSRNFFYLSAVEAFSGTVWGAYQIGMNNFIFETFPAHSRAGYNAFFIFTSGVAQFIGAMSGAWLYGHLPRIWGSPFVSLLFISGAVRAVAAVPMFALVREIREVRPAGPFKIIKALLFGIKPETEK